MKSPYNVNFTKQILLFSFCIFWYKKLDPYKHICNFAYVAEKASSILHPSNFFGLFRTRDTM